MTGAPTTIDFPRPLPARREAGAWLVDLGAHQLKASNLEKVYWRPEGYTKADLLAYYFNVAPVILPYLRDRPLTLKRMPDGADAEFFYAKQAPPGTPAWMRTAPVRSADTGKTIDYLLADDARSLLHLANLGCIEFHPWHARIDAIGRPDYAFFDLDPFGVDFGVVREVALLVLTVLDGLGLRGYARTSGATGMQVYVPIDRVHSAAQVREVVGRACRLITRADPGRTTMEWSISRREARVFLDHKMNTEGRNIAATYSLRPERDAPVATPLEWEEVAAGAEPRDFTIASIWERLDRVGDRFTPVLQGGQDLRAAMTALGMDPDEDPDDERHRIVAMPAPADPVEPGELATYQRMRDFSVTPEPAGGPETETAAPGAGAPRFVIQHHLATRLHHDLRLERGGTARSWAVPKGLPDVHGLRHLAVQTEDHPLEYLTFSGEIPKGEYGAGPMRIWDSGTYETVEWHDGKVSVRLHGTRHKGEYHLFRTGEDDARQWLVTLAKDTRATPPDLPPRLAPMLATAADVPFDDPDWLFEVKWDGVRALATIVRPGAGPPGSTTLISRQGNDLTPAYPELAPLWERVLARNAVLDGELVALRPDGTPSFQALQARMHLRDPAAVARARTRTPVTYLVFDLLAVDGRSMVDLQLTERLGMLDDLLVPGSAVQRSAVVAEHGVGLYEAVRTRGLEGIVAKRAASRYTPGRRSREWLKIKVRRRAPCVVGGWLPGEGGRGSTFASLLVGAYDGDALRFVGQVGTGFDDAELARVLALLHRHAAAVRPFDTEPDLSPGPFRRRGPGAPRWTEPVLVCDVEYAELTESARLRAPAYKGMRNDLTPTDCRLDAL